MCIRDRLEPKRIEKMREKLLASIQSLKIEIDDNRFEQEMIFYLEKFDITEEKVRLINHIKYFREVINENSPNGKKLGFIAQEMGREINTIGSKANDAHLQKIVVQMKDELEKNGHTSINPNAFLILDDCLYDNKWTKDKCMRSVFMNGRHWKLLFILTM